MMAVWAVVVAAEAMALGLVAQTPEVSSWDAEVCQ